ncbi:MAG: transketolase [Calditrichaceae bacterium]|nr:transketolase [Calditrichaceae bacterium]MBN2710209.1 transketolase [Calditrichaceae bacterium]
MSIDPKVAKKCADTIRLLAADGVQKANSGHPGMPMGMADCAFVLWTRFLKYNPSDPQWPGRDRFVLSAGHGSMLLYSMLHLSGYDVSLDDLKSFRQWGSRTPGHPEVGHTAGVETTTGPLGQGFSNGIGMAIAAKMTAARFNTSEYKLFGTENIFAIVSDGDLMEGVSSETASIAGHLKLGNVVYLYDDNKITIEGNTSLAFTENVAKRFEAYGWHVLSADAYDHAQIADALQKGIDEKEHPTLIIVKSHIGYGSPAKHDTSEVHGAPLGEEELKATKKNLGFPEDKTFYVPDEVKKVFDDRKEELKGVYKAWQSQFEKWKKTHKDLADLREKMLNKTLPVNLEKQLIEALPADTNATRNLSGVVMQKIAEIVPGFIGGSADLDPSTKTYLKKYPSVQAGQFEGRNFHYGIREHGMGSINNGLGLYGGFIPYGSTFLVFADYMRPPIRLAAIMGLQSIYVFTHDSIFVGEDGPTHQPVEHFAALRTIPNLHVLRPADGMETAVCWAMALRRQNGPTALLLTRQKVAALNRPAGFKPEDIAKGAYVISGDSGKPCDVVLIGTGSEVEPAVAAAETLHTKGISTRVVSMPSTEVFEAQPESYQKSVIPVSAKKIFIVEAGVSFGWKSYFNIPTEVICVDKFGSSAPYKLLAEKYGLTGPQIAEKILKSLK